jgi:glycosyltransferase involved in cell wall biosynthesis
MEKINPKLELSVILPCRNEESALGLCLEKIKKVFAEHHIDGEIIVSDSSTDNSPAIALAHGGRLIKHDKEGYGRAYLEGFKEARGQYLFMADADGTYDFAEIPAFLKELKTGYDFVIGNRFSGQMTKDSMPWTHRYLGNPFLSFLLRLTSGAKVKDAHCGMRAISCEALDQLNLKTPGMEFASEMVAEAVGKKLTIKELPIAYLPRQGQSKLRPLIDGWRHLKFMATTLLTGNQGWFLLAGFTFLLGYYLRAYLTIHTALPFSPYDAFYETNLFSRFFTTIPVLDMFSIKVLNYPIGYYLSLITRTFFRNIYVVYILGGAVFFALGREFSGKNIGGFLALALFAVASENLIHYTGLTYPSGLSYIFIVSALLFLLRYFRKQKDSQLIWFFVSGLLAISSYHTGAAAFIAILAGILISLTFSPQELDKKFLLAFGGLNIFYLFFILYFDYPQIVLISGALQKIPLLSILLIFIPVCLLSLLFVFLAQKYKNINLESLPLATLALASVLVFLPIDFFTPLLKLGAPNYYSSALTLNNYLAQALLLHSYLLLTLKKILTPHPDSKIIIIRGWLIGLAIIFVGLILENYYARILDYSFPLMFILFGWYWSDHAKLRKFTVIATIILLTASQLMIFHDPFTARRYYTQPEINSAQKIINWDLKGVMVSDLRTSALFNYLGQKEVIFFPAETKEYQALFYNHDQIKLYPFKPINYYVILSEKMNHILYSTNFETKPLTNQTFAFYDQNFKKIYSDNVMSVYLIHQK